ncbi:MAG: glycoside hydrolase family 28 protein [Eubacterium sp.]|nr:glycoside hydrolase family 28 protein [Eubacterium sp.]
MKFDIIAVFNRSITIELINDKRYNLDNPYSVYLDGKIVKTSKLNVTTINGLHPDQKYEIAVEYDGVIEKVEFTTLKETYLLDVRDNGAVGDGKTNDTHAIQAAISICPEGGTVHFTKGVYYTGPLFLKSNITLWLDKDAVLLGDTDRANYPILPGMVKNEDDYSKELSMASWEGNPLNSFASLITGVGVSNVDIIGEGLLDGNAQNSDWWVDVRTKRKAWRPKIIFLNNCKNVRVQQISVQNSPCWTIHPYYSDNISFLDMDIYNPDNSPNTDGFDPESCSNIKIIGTRISVGDDCIAIKSGKIYMGTKHYKKTDNIVIRNCRLARGHGAVTVGSEVAGGASDVHVERCLFTGTDRGLRVKTRRGRGVRSIIDDIHIENIFMDTVKMPFTVNMFYFCDPDGHTQYVQDQEEMPVDSRTPKVGSLYVKDVECTGINAVLGCAYALPEMPIDLIHLENINAVFLPENERNGECPIMMDNFQTMNGKSLYIRNVKKLEIKNVTIKGCEDKMPDLINIGERQIEGLNYAEI